MSDGSVSFEFRADGGDVLRTQEQIIHDQQKVIAEMKKTGGETGKATKRTKDFGTTFKQAFGLNAVSMLRGVASALGLAGGVAAAVRLVTNEVQTLIATQKRMAETSVTLADAQIAFRRNLGARTAEEAEAADQMISQISAATGVSERDLYMRASTAVSARGNLPVSKALEAVAASSMFVPEGAEQGTLVAGSILDLVQATGNKDVMSNLGLLFATAEQARVTELGKVGETVAPAILAGMQMDLSERESSAMYSLFTGKSADKSGKRTMSGMIDFLVEGKKFADEQGFEGNLIELAKTLQGDKDLMQAFQASLTPQVRSRGAILGFTSGEYQADFEENLRRLPSAEEAGAVAIEKLAQIRGGDLQGVADFARRLDAAKEQLETADPRQAKLGLLQEKFRPMLEDVGYGDLASKLAGITSFQSIPEHLAEFEGAATRLRSSKVELQTPISTGLRMSPDPEARWVAPTAAELEKAQILETLVAMLRAIEGGKGTFQVSVPGGEEGPMVDLLREIRDGINEANGKKITKSPEPLGKPSKDK